MYANLASPVLERLLTHRQSLSPLSMIMKSGGGRRELICLLCSLFFCLCSFSCCALGHPGLPLRVPEDASDGLICFPISRYVSCCRPMR